MVALVDKYRVVQKKVGPRLRDLAIAPAGGITQPRTKMFGQLCTYLARSISSLVNNPEMRT